MKKSWENPNQDVSAIKNVVLSVDQIDRLISLLEEVPSYMALKVDFVLLEKLEQSKER